MTAASALTSLLRDPLADLRQGHILDVLAELDADSVDCMVTSPPYLGLRKYRGEQETIWGGDVSCQHVWGDTVEQRRHRAGETNPGKEGYTKDAGAWGDNAGTFCARCGAWRGALGLEPSVDCGRPDGQLCSSCYICHMVEVMRAVRRVLKPTATVFLNIDDSYFGGKGQSGVESQDYQDARIAKGLSLNRMQQTGGPGETRALDDLAAGRTSGLKPLDLCLVPQRLALALQQDGWWLRSQVVWHKMSPMPESIRGWRWERHQVKVGGGLKHSGGTRGNANGDFETSLHTDGRIVDWADCPGCEKCRENGGLVLRKGSGRPVSSYEVILMLTKTSNYYYDTDAVR